LCAPDGRCLGHPRRSRARRIATRDALAALDRGVMVTRHYGPHGEARVQRSPSSSRCFAPAGALVVFGAVDFTRALVGVGKVLAFRSRSCDPRPVFRDKGTLRAGRRVVVEWPTAIWTGSELAGPRDRVCVLTHDTKFDVPAILGALRTPMSVTSVPWLTTDA